LESWGSSPSIRPRPVAASAGERDGRIVVIATVSGNFPNSPLNLEHIFLLEGDKIASLEIR
jgi:hypothetical protein